MEGRTALVLGGAGRVGEGIVQVLLEAGALVLVVSRSEKRLQDLQAFLVEVGPGALGTLVPLVADLSTEAGALALAERLAADHPPLDLAVAALGGWQSGANLWDIPMEQWEAILLNNLTTHFLAAKALLPAMRARGQGVYVKINGSGAIRPMAGAVPLTAMSAAQRMMGHGLAKEVAGSGLRLYEVLLGVVATRHRTDAKDDWISPQDVGAYVRDLYLEKVPHPEDIEHRLEYKKRRSSGYDIA